ncbi:hypothetical protein ACFSQU_08165 [Massilia sp. GCM10020059]|uniref:Uncharacterized protein n=1 Tax=Massilia agrisoli TaxID=2892444 RepID=A0ABS8IUV3_9BURK|nr:hypothetical protein [Massilia agrisoli]MCC6072407.1 hypothetical protein [Massilia agrisoli]
MAIDHKNHPAAPTPANSKIRITRTKPRFALTEGFRDKREEILKLHSLGKFPKSGSDHRQFEFPKSGSDHREFEIFQKTSGLTPILRNLSKNRWSDPDFGNEKAGRGAWAPWSGEL